MDHDRTTRRSSLKLAGAALASLVSKPANVKADGEIPSGANAIVIGAGVSGLAAARALSDAGKRVTVLEARDRIGGRTWTSSKWADAPMDLGASWIHGTQANPITSLAKKAGCRLATTRYDAAMVIHSDGTQLTTIQKKRLKELTDAIESAIQNAQEQDVDQSVINAVKDVLEWEQLSPEDRKLTNLVLVGMIDTEYAEKSDKQSAHWFDDDEAFDGDDAIFLDGYEAVPEFLSDGINVLCNQVVTEINWNNVGVTVKTDRDVYEADHAIVSLPLGVLKAATVKFMPDLPALKQQAIRSLGMGVLNKCYLRFPRLFWPANYDWLEYIPEEGNHWVEWFSLARPTGKPILVGFNASDVAREIEKWSDKETVSSAMQTLRKMFGNEIPGPTDCQVTRWASDPLSFGSYSYNALGSTPKMRRQLAKPLGNRVFFAGEATSRKHFGTVHGAYLSGVRAAQELLGVETP